MTHQCCICSAVSEWQCTGSTLTGGTVSLPWQQAPPLPPCTTVAAIVLSEGREGVSVCVREIANLKFSNVTWQTTMKWGITLVMTSLAMTSYRGWQYCRGQHRQRAGSQRSGGLSWPVAREVWPHWPPLLHTGGLGGGSVCVCYHKIHGVWGLCVS